MPRFSVQRSALDSRSKHIRVSYRIYIFERTKALHLSHQPLSTFKESWKQFMSLTNPPLGRNWICSAYYTGCTQGQDRPLSTTFYVEYALWMAYGVFKTTFCFILSVWISHYTVLIKWPWLKHIGGEKRLTNGSSLSSWALIMSKMNQIYSHILPPSGRNKHSDKIYS